MKLIKGIALSALVLTFYGCKEDDKEEPVVAGNPIELKSHSVTPSLMKLSPEFSAVKVYPLLSSEDKLLNTPNFIYGSMADGAGLIRNADGTFTLINNIEADYSIARISLDKTFKPIAGEYILNAVATSNTAQCSGSLITPNEHGFGPLYLSGGEWGGSSNGVFVLDPFKSSGNASSPEMLNAMGEWSTENAVVIGKDAYPDKTVVFIGDDHADNTVPSGQLGMYVGNRGDLNGGKLYGLKVTSSNINYEMDMVEGTSYDMEFVELLEKDLNLLDAEAKQKGVMGFSRLEDIDWRRGNAEAQREIYFAVTGRKSNDLIGKGTIYGRVYKLELNDSDPTKGGKITCVLDGDKVNGKAKMFHSPDNIVVTENYAYIQEDPNGYPDNADKTHFARLYQYNLNTGEIKTVMECDQVKAETLGYGVATSTWEITGMIDISETVGIDQTFLMITQNHGWEKKDGTAYTDPLANSDVANSAKEGSVLYIVKGLAR